MNDPVSGGLAEGLKPADVISVRDLALIGIDAKLGRLEKLHERAADALERIATASETLTALLASVIGVGRSTCYPPDSRGETTQPPVFFLRSGDGAKAFVCDANNIGGDDDE